MSEPLVFHYDIDGEDFISAGQASIQIKKNLRRIGLSPEVLRRFSIDMYEGEINIVIHAKGCTADVMLYEDRIEIILADKGPGISNIEEAMQEGFSTASDTIRSLGFGAGMGLPNMKRYSDKMTIDTTVGVGTTVTMVINIT